MMKLTEINNLIEEFKQGECSLSTIRNLAALYTVQEKLSSTPNDAVLTELYEIVPSYKQYIIAKRRQQLKEITDDNVLDTLNRLGKEIRDFIQTLYTSTSNERERQVLHKMVIDLKDIF